MVAPSITLRSPNENVANKKQDKMGGMICPNVYCISELKEYGHGRCKTYSKLVRSLQGRYGIMRKIWKIDLDLHLVMILTITIISISEGYFPSYPEFPYLIYNFHFESGISKSYPEFSLRFFKIQIKCFYFRSKFQILDLEFPYQIQNFHSRILSSDLSMIYHRTITKTLG